MSQQNKESGTPHVIQQLQERIRVLERENETLRGKDIGPLPELLSSGILNLPVMAEMATYCAGCLSAHQLRQFFLVMLHAQGLEACHMAGACISKQTPRLKGQVAIQMRSIEATARVLEATGKLPKP